MAAKKATKKAAKKTTKKAAKKATKKATKKKAAKKKTTRKSTKKAAKAAGPMRAVWVVCDRTGSPVEYYAYRDRSAADEKAAALHAKKNIEHWVRSDRIPIEPEPDPEAEAEG